MQVHLANLGDPRTRATDRVFKLNRRVLEVNSYLTVLIVFNRFVFLDRALEG